MGKRFAIALMVVALVAGACGDDDGGSPVPSQGDTGGSSTDTPFGDGDFTGFTDQECLQIVLAWSQAASAAFTPGTSGEDPAAALEALSRSVPPEIADDFATYAEAVSSYWRALTDAGVDLNDPNTFTDPEAQAARAAAAEEFEATGVQEAGDNISAFLDAQCSQG